MQLSLPVPTFPTRSAPNGEGKHAAAADADATNGDEPVGDSFESLLSQDANDAPASSGKMAGSKEEKAEKEKETAALLATFFWVPVVPATPPPPSELTVALSEADATAAAIPADAAGIFSDETGEAGMADPTANLTFKSCRAFGSIVADPKTTKGRVDAELASGLDVMAEGTPTPVPSARVEAMQVKKAAEESVVSGAVMPDGAKAPLALKEKPGAEKIADAKTLPGEDFRDGFSFREKHFLNVIQKEVKEVAMGVGIGVAHVTDTMSSPASARSKTASISEVPAAFTFSGESAPVGTLTLAAPAPVATVRETMAAVITAVETLERRADVGQKSVDLQFDVGGEKLGLRVELRDGIVQATFRTESSEMNRALSREWQAVVQPALARDIRLAEPVFSSSNSHNQSASGSPGHGAPQEREQPARASFAPSLKGEFYEANVADSTPAVSPVSHSSKLLNALA